ncbi:hypothetical protein GMA12_03835 [Kocuria sediminis]|uniref:Uncharacterized protein n=1 Tax=Kocuria sediminis TaxID=1038857 RepID=A0A6N8GJ24_9MICC|nr:hypothetical protein [Kocuria sediminis]MUN62280.1 hypothetical protein [Kocuria sediminis]
MTEPAPPRSPGPGRTQLWAAVLLALAVGTVLLLRHVLGGPDGTEIGRDGVSVGGTPAPSSLSVPVGPAPPAQLPLPVRPAPAGPDRDDGGAAAPGTLRAPPPGSPEAPGAPPGGGREPPP